VPKLTAAEIASVTDGRLHGEPDVAVHSVVADSRAVTSDTAFAAVRGGAAYVNDAIAAGAPIAIVAAPDEAESAGTIVIVDDVVAALGSLAAEVRTRLDVRVVGITGSTGKTLTKDFVAAALGGSVHATPRSFNAEIGVPLVVLTCPDEADVLVVELGARHSGEISELCRMVSPDVGVVTGIGVSHLSEFGSRDAIARTKAELLAWLPAQGTAVVPSNDEYLGLMADVTAARVMTVGPGGHVSYGASSVDPDGRTHGWVRAGGRTHEISIPVPGRALVRNAAIAVAVAIDFGVAAEDAVARIASAPTSVWRMQILRTGDYVIVNDAWNANPTSSASALRTVREMAQGAETWAVLGAMAELGPIGPAAHERIGRLARALGFTGVVAIGDPARAIAAGAGSIAHVAENFDDAADVIATRAEPGAWVLVKGSRVVRMEYFPDVLAQRVGVSP
jgi:UDP-N-acetylmuramoyl-tripeptide--D-alanyl-D-alanine ligase